jgi:hypothetical protein
MSRYIHISEEYYGSEGVFDLLPKAPGFERLGVAVCCRVRDLSIYPDIGNDAIFELPVKDSSIGQN